jgi:DNA-binding FadR family transcriptional regulator
MMTFQPVRKQRVFEVICDQVRQQLRDRSLKPGDKLPAERALAAELGVGRNAVREALRTLEIMGLVELRNGVKGGAFIGPGDPETVTRSLGDLVQLGSLSLDQLTEARREIARTVTHLACRRATEADLAELAANIDAAERLTAAGHLEDKAVLNIDFHNILARATGNPVLALIMDPLTDLVDRLSRQVDADETEEIIRSRRRFLALLRARDAEGAAAEMDAHLKRLHRLYLDAEAAGK